MEVVGGARHGGGGWSLTWRWWVELDMEVVGGARHGGGGWS